jgi:hypothetical protein
MPRDFEDGFPLVSQGGGAHAGARLSTASFETGMISAARGSTAPSILADRSGGFTLGMSASDAMEVEMYDQLSGRGFVRVSKGCYLASVLAVVCCGLFAIVLTGNDGGTGLLAVTSDSSSGSPASAFCTAGTQIPYSDRTGNNACGSASSETQQGDPCEYTCAPNFQRTGIDGAPPIHRCGADGKFSGGSCVFAGCEPLEGLMQQNHTVTTCDTIGALGDTCTSTCKPGFADGTTGDATVYSHVCRKWNGVGQWFGNGFSCTPIKDCSVENGGCGVGFQCIKLFHATNKCLASCHNGFIHSANRTCVRPATVQCDR